MNPSAKSLRTFYALALTQIVSLLGSRMTAFALAMRITLETGQATPVLTVAFCVAIAEVLLNNVAGLVVDRYPRRFVMALADTGSGFGTVALLWAFLSGHFSLPLLYAVSLWQSACQVFQERAAQTVITQLVPDDHRERANALREISGSLAGIFAPALAGLLIGLIDVTGIMLIDLLTFAVAVGMVLVLPIPPMPRLDDERDGTLWVQLTAGFRFLAERRTLLYFILYFSCINFVLDATTTLIVPYALARTGSTSLSGLVVAAADAGIILGGVLIGFIRLRMQRSHIIIWTTVVMGLAMGLFGLARSPLMLVLCMAGVTLPLAFGNPPFFSMMQAKVPAALQGRVFAVVMQISSALRPVGLLIMSPLVDRVVEPLVGTAGWERVAPLLGNEAGAGMGLILFVSGLAMAASAVAFYAIRPIRQMEAKLPDYP